ncbi:Uncharacterised protein [Mycoplasma putrefaciens]|nr:Uncharacterised protein [Mycoplasma putrefaciens]
MLLDSKLFDPISNLKNQNKTDMPSTPRGDMPSALRLARIGEDK